MIAIGGIRIIEAIGSDRFNESREHAARSNSLLSTLDERIGDCTNQ